MQVRALGRPTVVGALLCAAVAVVVPIVTTVPAMDLAVYRDAAGLALHGGGLYDTNLGLPDYPLPFTYPPFAAWALALTTVLPWQLTVLLWNWCNLMALWWVVGLCLPAATRRRTLTRSGVFVALVVTIPVCDHVGFGQVNLLLMALCLADVVRPATRVPRGVLVGLAAAIKMTPLLFLAWFLLRRDGRAALTGLATAAGATAVAAALSWHDTWEFATRVMWGLPERVAVGQISGAGNQSVGGIWYWAAPGHPGLLAASSLAVFAAGLAAAWWLLRRGSDDAVLASAVIVGIAIPLLTPVSWPHHVVFLLPAVVLLLARPRRAARVAAVVVWVLLVSRGPYLGQLWWDHGPGAAAPLAVLLRETLVVADVVAILALTFAVPRRRGPLGVTGRPPARRSARREGCDPAGEVRGEVAGVPPL